MDFWATLNILVRRWYIVTPVLVASLILAAVIVGGVPATYQANAWAVVLGPDARTGTGSDRNTPANPYLQLGGSQDVVAKVLLTLMDSDSVRQTLKDQGVAGTWTLTVTGTSGPVLQLNVNEATPKEVVRATSTILQVAEQRLTDIQKSAGAPPDQLARLSILSTPRTASPVLKTKIRTGLALGIVGLVLACGVALAFEGVNRRREIHRVKTPLGPEEDKKPSTKGIRFIAAASLNHVSEGAGRTGQPSTIDGKARQSTPARLREASRGEDTEKNRFVNAPTVKGSEPRYIAQESRRGGSR